MEVSAQLRATVDLPKGQKNLLFGGSRTGLEPLEKSNIFALSGNEPRFFGRLTRSLDALNTTLSRLLLLYFYENAYCNDRTICKILQ